VAAAVHLILKMKSLAMDEKINRVQKVECHKVSLRLYKKIDYRELASTLSALKKETDSLKRSTVGKDPLTAEERIRKTQGFASDEDEEMINKDELVAKKKI